MESIKLYRREIRPMLYEHPTQGFNPKTIPALGEDSWYPEDQEETIRQSLEPGIKEKHHGWIDLVFDERYVDKGDRYLLCKASDYPTENAKRN